MAIKVTYTERKLVNAPWYNWPMETTNHIQTQYIDTNKITATQESQNVSVDGVDYNERIVTRIYSSIAVKQEFDADSQITANRIARDLHNAQNNITSTTIKETID